MSHLYCFVFNQDHGHILRSFMRGPIGTWHSRRMSQNQKPVRQGQNGQRVNDIICPLDNPIEAIRFTEPLLRAHWAWAISLSDALDISSAGPLLCGGITVFAPLLTFRVKPTERVGSVGIGGLGHLALKFANAWGCEVTAFKSNMSKTEELRRLGAHRVVSSRNSAEILAAANSLDFLLITVNMPLDWTALLKTLKPNGRMHVVGAVLEPMPISAFDLIIKQKSVSGSPTGAPPAISAMLVEHFPLSKVNDAIEHLAAGRARYRVVLDVA